VRIGAHESVSAGLHLAFGRGEADGCEAMQIFSGFNTRWEPRLIEDEEASRFRSEAARLDWPLLSHACYLINLASPDKHLWRRSVEALVLELGRCQTLGIPYVVLHPGAHMGAGEEQGLRRVAKALSDVLRRTDRYEAGVLIENTAGQGTNLGYSFAHLGQLLELVGVDAGHERLGVCIDTCHAFAAGYDLRTPRGYREAFTELARAIDGLQRIKAFHLNDSMRELGSRIDRHASIGEGRLGRASFARLVNDPRFSDLPAVVETPPEADGRSSFARNIRALKNLRRSKKTPDPFPGG
jgi:deoxyribonuclease-4